MPSADTVEMSPEELLAASDRLMRTAVPGARGLWPRTVAFLLRLALETSIDEFWRATAPGMVACSRRAQLACLREFADYETATRASATWGTLSSACHYHSYDLAATASELRVWHRAVQQLAVSLQEKAQPRRLALQLPEAVRKGSS